MDFTVWIVLVSMVSCLTLISAIAVCVCCRRKTPKNEWLGVDGMVTINNPDENVNHIPAAPSEPLNVNANIVADVVKRPVTSNTRRSLPDIPSDGGAIGVGDPALWDNTSELYATVEDKTASQPNPYPNFALKRHTLPNGIDRPSLSQHSSLSQADDSIYAKLKENPYDKVKKPEHPYAKVQSVDSKEQDESSGDATPRTSLLWGEGSSHMATVDPTAPPRSRPSSIQGSLGSDIPAATAVAGRVAASQELPYMTPPVTQPQHFSGDSQDSSKGYTSISVREPLANIRAQTKELNRTRRLDDPHYSTVSDDSDEMYTTIEEPNNTIYTSGSETYAQIQPLTVTVEVNQPPSSLLNQPDEIIDELYEPPPPPSVHSLKNVTHSRQASSSSCNSSVANIGSPKPEKRQANSPLPPPPSISPDMYSKVEKKRDREASAAKNLEAMYAKVQKNKKKDDDQSSSPNTSSTLPTENSDNCSRKSWSMNSRSSLQESSQTAGSSKSISDINISTSSSTTQNDHCYETLNKNKAVRRKCSETDPGYEIVEQSRQSSTEKKENNECSTNVDPGYEVLNNKPPSDCDPNYEVLRHRASSFSDSAGYSTIGNGQLKANCTVENVPSSSSDQISTTKNITDGYSVVNKRKKVDPGYEELQSRTSSSYESDPRSLDEPNYESMPSESASDHNYAQLKSNGSESDPNYETVSRGDPNYESVKYLGVKTDDPPYERLQNEDSSGISDLNETNSAATDYETVKNAKDETTTKSVINNECTNIGIIETNNINSAIPNNEISDNNSKKKSTCKRNECDSDDDAYFQV